MRMDLGCVRCGASALHGFTRGRDGRTRAISRVTQRTILQSAALMIGSFYPDGQWHCYHRSGNAKSIVLLVGG